jgi:predicted nucleic acid-binding protein
MSAKPFLDTNVLVYAFSREDRRQVKALALLADGGLVSVQVLNEFVSVSRRKTGYAWDEIDRQRAAIRKLLEPPIALTSILHEQAVRLAQKTGYDIYDALILAAALQARCPLLYSEDMQDGRVIEGMTIRNPFG